MSFGLEKKYLLVYLALDFRPSVESVNQASDVFLSLVGRHSWLLMARAMRFLWLPVSLSVIYTNVSLYATALAKSERAVNIPGALLMLGRKHLERAMRRGRDGKWVRQQI